MLAVKVTDVPAHIVVPGLADTLTVGAIVGFTVKVLLAAIVPHDPPLVVSVNVTDDGAVADAV